MHQKAFAIPPMTRLPPIPFGLLYASAVAFNDTKLMNAQLWVPIPLTGPLSSTGKIMVSSQRPESQSASWSMYVGTANCQGLGSMAHIPVPSVATPGILPLHAPKIDISKVL